MVATVERVQRGWLVLIDGKPQTLHDERSCDYAWSNAQSEADRIKERSAKGLVELRLWLTPEQKERVMKYVARLKRDV